MIPTRFNPMGWQPYGRKLSYIESSEYAQYIDTGYTIPDHGSGSIYIDFGTPDEINAMVYYFGAAKNSALTMLQQSYISNTPYQLFMGYWTGTDTHGHPGVVGARDHLKIDYQYGTENNTSTVTWSDGMTSTDTTTYSFHSGSPLYLFRISGSGQVASGVPVKIYGFKVWENGSAARDMIPVLDKSGVPCMYDRCTRSFYYNAGTGTFNYA